MGFIEIVTLILAVGACVAGLLAYMLVGFRADGHATARWWPRSVEAGFETKDDLVDQIKHLQAMTRQLCEQMVERELLDEARWRSLDEARDEVGELRAKVLELRLDLAKRLRDSDESRRRRERELERRQGRQLERHRERELIEAGPVRSRGPA